MPTIVVSNQKGGVGKTTTCINLAAELGRCGYSVLAVDMDPQANCTSGLGVNASNLSKSLYNVLLGDIPMRVNKTADTRDTSFRFLYCGNDSFKGQVCTRNNTG